MQSSSRPRFQGTDRFELRRQLGTGAMGVVFEALDRETGARVALKTLRFVTGDALFRLKNEYRALQDIRHRNLCGLGQLIEEEGEWFFTMELVDGVDFLAYVRGGAAAESAPSYDEARLRHALVELSVGLLALHRAGKIHRDIKPSNVLVTEEGRAVLLDFGLTTERHGEARSTEADVVGTALYMAPEQAAEGRVGPEADWYGVGALLYEALTGEPPFTGTLIKVLASKHARDPEPPSSRLAEVPEDLEALCMALLARDPAARPTGREVLARLGAHDPQARVSSTSRQSDIDAPFVGRAAELAALRDAFDQTQAGQAVTVIVEGESGVGKSVLLRRLTSSLDRDVPRVLVLSGRCFEQELVPFKAFDGVVDELSRHLRRLAETEAAAVVPPGAAILPRLFPVLERVKPIARAPLPARETRDPHELRRRAFAALRELFYGVAERQPVVLAIDDLQWADADSLKLLADVLRPPDAPPMLVLLATRPASESEPGGAELAAGLPGDVRLLRLGALAGEPARELARLLLAQESLEESIDPEVIVAEAKGHPLYMGELVRHAALSGEVAGTRVRLDDAIWRRAARLDESDRRVLELLCVAGAPVAQEVLTHAAEVESKGLARSLSALRETNLVRSGGGRVRPTFEAYHDRVRQAVSSHLSPEVRRHHHERLAIALEAARGPADLLLRHYEAAGDREAAARCARDAARRATEGLAFDRAAELYEAALRLAPPDEGSSGELRLHLARSLARAGRGREAAEAYLHAAEGRDVQTRTECLRNAAGQWLATGYVELGLDAMRTLLAEIGESLPATPRRALGSVLLHRLGLSLRGASWKARHASEIPAAELARLDVYQAVADGLAVVDNIRGADFQARSLLRALRLGEPTRVAHALAMESVFRASQGGRSAEVARRLVDVTARIAEETQDPYLLAWTDCVKGAADHLSGRFGNAAERLRRGELALREHGAGATAQLNQARFFRVTALVFGGRFRELRRAYDEYLQDALRRGDRYLESTIRRAANRTWLVAGDPERAMRDLEQSTWAPPEGGYHLQHYYELNALAEIALYRGATARDLAEFTPSFEGLGRSMLLRVQQVRARSRWLRGRLLVGAAGDAGDGARRAEEASRIARQLEGEGIAFAGVWGALLRAGVATFHRQPDVAARSLADAARAAEEHDMPHVAAAARIRLGEILGGDKGRELDAAGRGWMIAEGVAAPDGVTAILVPMPVTR